MKLSKLFMLAVTGTAVATLGLTSCGKDEKKKSGGSSAPAVAITQAKQENGTASISFASETGRKDFQCRVIWGQKQGQWVPCPNGTFSQPINPSERFMLQARVGDDGEVTSKEFQGLPNLPESDGPAFPAAPTAPDAPAAPSIDLTNIPLLGRRSFSVPQGMQLVRYSSSATPPQQLAYAIMNPSNPQLKRWLPQPLCGRNIPINGVTITPILDVISSPAGARADYCSYQTSSDVLAQQMKTLDLGHDQIDVASLAGAPLAYISAAILTGQQDAATAQRLFNRICRGNTPMQPIVTPFNNVPVQTQGLGVSPGDPQPGEELPQYEARTNVLHCQANYGSSAGTAPRRLDVINFKIRSTEKLANPCVGPNCPVPETLEYTYVLESNGRTTNNNISGLVQRALTTLRFYVR